MAEITERAPADAPREGAGRTAVLAAAAACGAIVANLYYGQPLVDLIARDLGIAPTVASAMVALTQIGYAIGLIAIAPLVDIVESRRLLTISLLVAAVALVLSAFAPTGATFLAASLLVGISSVAAQMLLPLVAGMEPEATRGRVVGAIMSGLLFGILLARPVAGIVADAFGWRSVFGLSAVLMGATALVLRALIPSRRPEGGVGYFAFVGSMVDLVRRYPTLRRRALYQAAMFGSFSVFWTSSPMRLSSAYGWSHSMIGLFALAGAGGALIAPVAGRLADSGMTRIGTLVAIGGTAAGFAIAGLDGVLGFGTVGVAALLVGAIVLDMGVQTNMVLGQREIYALDPAARGRINGVYVATLFLGGAVGSALTSPTFAHFGWPGVAILGAGMPLVALVFAALEQPDD